jgi:Universal stress protein family
VLHDKDPAHALVGLAASTTEPTALLVMATHGRTGWDRLGLGSVTIAAVQGATTPVLVVPSVPDRPATRWGALRGGDDCGAVGPGARWPCDGRLVSDRLQGHVTKGRAGCGHG